jgi:hypothetical protein
LSGDFFSAVPWGKVVLGGPEYFALAKATDIPVSFGLEGSVLDHWTISTATIRASPFLIQFHII